MCNASVVGSKQMAQMSVICKNWHCVQMLVLILLLLARCHRYYYQSVFQL